MASQTAKVKANTAPGKNVAYEAALKNSIMDAAIVCMGTKGIDKTRIGDIANELGIARQTIYNYFKNKNELFHALFSREAVSLAQGISDHIDRFDSLADKFTQAFVFAVQELPKHTVLSHVISTGNQFIHDMGISRETMQAFGELGLKNVFDAEPRLQTESAEICELLCRNIVSTVTLPDQNPRDEVDLADYFKRRLLPGIGLNS